MRICISLFSLFLAVIFGLPCRAQCDSVSLAKADTLYAHKNYKAAAKIFQKLVDKGSCTAYAYRGLAGCEQARNGPNEEMVRLMNLAVAAAPTDPVVLRSRSKAYQSLRMYDRSLADLKAAMPYLSVDSDRVDNLTGQTYDLMNMRRFEEAEEVLEHSYAIDSLAPGTLNNLALVTDELGHSPEAFAWMAKYIALDTTESTGYLNMGFMLATKERYPEALHYYELAEKHGASDGLFFNNRGYAKLMSGDVDGALKDIDWSIKLFPSNSYAYRNRGLAYRKLGRNDDACSAFETALALGYTKQYGNDVKQVYDAYCH